MGSDTGITAIAHVIQLSVAPVFLLSGVGGMLTVLTNRLARVNDRARALAQQLRSADPDVQPRIEAQLETLGRRARLASLAIALFTLTALFICAVVAILFLAVSFGFDASVGVAVLFIAAMTAIVSGLLFFLREIFLATSNLRTRTHLDPNA